METAFIRKLKTLSRLAVVWGLFSSVACVRPPLPSAPDTPSECELVISRVDTAISRADVSDTAVFPVRGHPYLRSNRFLAAIADRLTTEDAQDAWLEHLHRLDQKARTKELTVLDADRMKTLARGLSEPPDRSILTDRVINCTDRLFRRSLGRPGFAEAVSEAIHSPSEYSDWRRVVGLYPLVSLPVIDVSNRVFNAFKERHQQPPEALPVAGERIAYVHGPPTDIDPTHGFRPANRDRLGLPQISEADVLNLAAYFAPVLIQDTVAAYDRIGRVEWSDGKIVVNPSEPTGYYYVSYGFLNAQPAFQLNYSFWYPARSGPNAPWFEHGRLDGITVRISLDADGRPFMMDIMNNCGCYHFFVPDRSRVAEVRNPDWGPETLVPSWLPEAFPEQRVLLYVNSGWHQVDHIAAGEPSETSRAYTLRPYEELEMLPRTNGERKSLFNADGIARGSGRIEPLFFFSMGIPSVGSMRQRGHHAIKLVGKDHFDDPGLFNRWFRFRDGK